MSEQAKNRCERNGGMWRNGKCDFVVKSEFARDGTVRERQTKKKRSRMRL